MPQELIDLLKENFEDQRGNRAIHEAEQKHDKEEKERRRAEKERRREEKERKRDQRWEALNQEFSEILKEGKEQAAKRLKKDEEMLEVLKAMVNRLSS